MKKILVLTNFLAAARAAADLGIILAAQADCALVLLHAWSEPLLFESTDAQAFPMEEMLQAQQNPNFQLQQEADRLQQTQQRMRLSNAVMIETVSIKKTLMQAAEYLVKDIHPLLVLLGNDFRDGNHLPADICKLLKCPVLIVPIRDKVDRPVRSMVFATDLDERDAKLLDNLKQLSSSLDCRLTIGHISGMAFNIPGEEQMNIARFMHAMERSGLALSCYEQGYADNTSTGIEAFAAKKNADLLVLVQREHSFFWLWFHKSISKQIRSHHRFPILLIPEKH